MVHRLQLLILLSGVVFNCIAIAEETWVSIDTAAHTLRVKQGENVLAEFDNISIGRGGVNDQGLRLSGDDRTPLGTFRVAWINRNSSYYRFFGLDYPSQYHAKRAYFEGLIDESTYNTIMSAIRSRRIPPQNTRLGGYVGIHGVGEGDKEIHKQFNWTHGCVALTNKQIDRLSRWVRKGTKVVIH